MQYDAGADPEVVGGMTGSGGGAPSGPGQSP